MESRQKKVAVATILIRSLLYVGILIYLGVFTKSTVSNYSSGLLTTPFSVYVYISSAGSSSSSEHQFNFSDFDQINQFLAAPWTANASCQGDSFAAENAEICTQKTYKSPHGASLCVTRGNWTCEFTLELESYSVFKCSGTGLG
jgi:hypothetical protein